jgi:hypothetical protein
MLLDAGFSRVGFFDGFTEGPHLGKGRLVAVAKK